MKRECREYKLRTQSEVGITSARAHKHIKINGGEIVIFVGERRIPVKIDSRFDKKDIATKLGRAFQLSCSSKNSLNCHRQEIRRKPS